MRRTLYVCLLALIAGPALGNSLILDATTKSLELETSAAVSTDYVVSYVDNTTTTFTPGSNPGNVATATTTTILAAPAASTQRQVKWVSVRNRSTTTAQTVTLKLDVSATEYHITPAVTLAAGESLRMDADGALSVLTSAGVRKEQATNTSGYSGMALDFYKIGTASEAAAVRYGFAKDSGLPGAWVPGTPGLNGATLACNTTGGATTAGSHYLPDPASGAYYLVRAGFTTSIAHLLELCDPLWYNTGLVVTTTTAQAITHPGIPARDARGTTNGDGVGLAIYVTTATTNAGAITNTTASYTDSDGNAGNTATIASFPATAVAGTFVPFQLAAGDRGVRSVQSVTLGTSYAGGAISLVQYRTLASIPNPIVNVGGIMSGVPFYESPGVRLYNGTCLWTRYVSSGTTATNLAGSVAIMER